MPGQRQHDDGFTLVELLIAIAILAIVISIVAINVTNVMADVSDTAMKTELGIVQTAIVKYNTWDVAVLGAEPIKGVSDYRLLPDPAAPFSKYLSTSSRYYYNWGDNGMNLTNQPKP